MAKNNNLTDFLTDIANAIRQKKGTNALINPQNFSSEIANISGGGSTDFTQMDSLLDELEDAVGEYKALQYTAYAVAQSGVTYTTISDLSDYTNEEIEAISKAISNCSGITSSTQTIYLSNETSISVGATRSYILSSQEQMTDRIIGFNHDDLTNQVAYGETTLTGKAGITWQTVDCLKDRYLFNSNDNGTATNQGGWNGSKIRTITIPQIKMTLPQDMQNMLKAVNKKAANGGSSNYTQIVTSSDYLFLLSEIEVFGSTSYAQNGSEEGSQYKYYVFNSSANDRIKNYDNEGTVAATYWWLRSSNGTAKIANVNTTGGAGAGSSISTTRGVAFAYCT